MASPIVENLLSPRLLSHLWEIYLKNPNHTSPQYGNSPYWLFTQSRCLLTGYSSIMLTAGKKNLFPKKSGVDEYKIEFGKLLRLGLLQTTIICGSVVILLCSLLSLGCLRRKSNYGKWIHRDISDLGPIDLFWARWPCKARAQVSIKRCL